MLSLGKIFGFVFQQALMAMPAPDFSLCLFLIPERVVWFLQSILFFVVVFLVLMHHLLDI